MGVVAFGLGVVLALPLLLGAAAALLAGVEGAAAGPRLPWGRHLTAAAAGGAVGCGLLAGAALAGLYAALLAGAGLAGCFAAVFVASALGLAAAHGTASAVAARLDRYRCRGCRGRFRAPWPADLCPRCAAQQGDAATGAAAGQFALRWRELSGHAPADERAAEGPTDAAPEPAGPPPRARVV